MSGFSPVFGEPAGVLDDMLVAADLHLGYEKVYQESGVEVPSQMLSCARKLLALARKNRCKELLLLGDVKHNLPGISYENWSEIPVFFSHLMKKCKVRVVLGNHDGGLKGLLPAGVDVFDSKFVKNGIIFAHGHKWASGEGSCIILGHSHPAYCFTDRMKAKTTEKVWLRGRVDMDAFPKDMRSHSISEFIVMPAFNPFLSGSPVNQAAPLGPFFRARAFVKPEAFLLDGSPLGKVITRA